jgi:hypothetical protein
VAARRQQRPDNAYKDVMADQAQPCHLLKNTTYGPHESRLLDILTAATIHHLGLWIPLAELAHEGTFSGATSIFEAARTLRDDGRIEQTRAVVDAQLATLLRVPPDPPPEPDISAIERALNAELRLLGQRISIRAVEPMYVISRSTVRLLGADYPAYLLGQPTEIVNLAPEEDEFPNGP